MPVDQTPRFLENSTIKYDVPKLELQANIRPKQNKPGANLEMNYWQRLGGPNAITIQAWLVLAPISIFLTFGFTPEGTRGSYALWMLVGLLAHLATGAVLLVAWLTILSNRPRKPRPVTAVLIFALAGIARGATVSFTAEYFGLLDQAEYLLRMRSGAVLVMFWFGFSAIMIDASKKYRDSYLELQNELREYSTLERNNATSVQNYRERIVKEVEATISQAFSSKPNSGQLREVVSQVISPLSRELYTKDKYPELSDQIQIAIQSTRRVPLKSVANAVFSQTPFNPGLVAILALGGTAASRLWTTEAPALLLDIGSNFALIYLIFSLANRVTNKNPKLRALFSVPVWTVTGIIGSALTFYVSERELPADYSGIYLLSTNFLAASMFAGILVAYEKQRQLKLSKLSETISKAQWLRARTKQALWCERKRLARVIHSKVQSRLLATAARLSRSGTSQSLTDQEIEELRADCQKAMLAPEKIEPIESFLDQTKEIWEGAIEISFPNTTELSKILNRDASAASATLEVIREAVNNAAKHADASEISIHAEIDSNQENLGAFLNLSISNNGVRQKKEPVQGLGSQILSEVSSEWKFTISDSRATLNAKIPLVLTS